MKDENKKYTTQLQAGLGMIDETRSLLGLWEPGMNTTELFQKALDSGQFPLMSARRLRNVVAECFAPRLLNDDSAAQLMKQLASVLPVNAFAQLLFVYTCRANTILADFVRDVYWPAYSAGRDSITNGQSRNFVEAANRDGKTNKMWSESTITRVASYLLGCCGDFGLLASGQRGAREILPLRIHDRVTAILAYDLHLSGSADNRVLQNPEWALFGLERPDVLSELKRLSLKGFFIIQAAGPTVRISWQCKSIKELVDVVAQS